MIKHIVFFRVDHVNKDEIIQNLKTGLDLLPLKIKVIKSFETGINISSSNNAYDLSLISEFESLGTLEQYREHPEHLKIITYIADNNISLKVVDYEF